MSKKEYEILIDLSYDRDAYAITSMEEIIHLRELNEILNFIEQSLEKAKKYTENHFEYKMIHDTIVISGERGSGKTTLMMSLLNFLNGKTNGQNYLNIEDKNEKILEIKEKLQKLRPDIKVLKIFDPTLIEEKGHVVLYLISQIKEIVEIYTGVFDECLHDKNSEYSKWYDTYKDLAEGLSGLDGIGENGLNGKEWLDSEFIVEQGIRTVNASRNFGENFHKFILASLKAINKKAFLLCFDDIDTNFKKGLPVIEALRKYITTPQIIPVLSGDLNLYSFLIRKQQWENMDINFFKAEQEDKKFHPLNVMISKLEEQYFLKVLKPERRVNLSTLYEKVISNLYSIKIRNFNPAKKTEIPELMVTYGKIFESMGINDSFMQKEFFRFTANLPIRTQKQLLFAYANKKEENIESFSQKLLEIFWNDLVVKNIDVSILRNQKALLVIHLFKYLINNNILTDGYTFRTIYDDEILNSAQFVSGFILSETIKINPSLIFELWLRVNLTREMTGLIKNQKENNTLQNPSLANYIDLCRIETKSSIRHIARKTTSYFFGLKQWFGQVTNDKPWHGTIPLYGLAEKINSSSENKNIRIDYILKELSKEDNLGGIIGYTGLSIGVNHKGQEIPIYSIYNVLGVIGVIFERLDTENYYTIFLDKTLDKVSKEILNMRAVGIIVNALFRSGQPQQYAIPFGTNELTPNNNDEYYDEEEIDEPYSLDNDYAKKLDYFSKVILEWYKNFPKEYFHPGFLGKIFIRFFYILNSLDTAQIAENEKLGVWMHRMIIAFLHAIFIEEVLASKKLNQVEFERRNPISNDSVFQDNIVKIIKKNFSLIPGRVLEKIFWYDYYSLSKDENTLMIWANFYNFSLIQRTMLLSKIEAKIVKTILNDEKFKDVKFQYSSDDNEKKLSGDNEKKLSGDYEYIFKKYLSTFKENDKKLNIAKVVSYKLLSSENSFMKLYKTIHYHLINEIANYVSAEILEIKYPELLIIKNKILPEMIGSFFNQNKLMQYQSEILMELSKSEFYKLFSEVKSNFSEEVQKEIDNKVKKQINIDVINNLTKEELNTINLDNLNLLDENDNKFLEEKESLPFFNWFVKCPFFYYFLEDSMTVKFIKIYNKFYSNDLDIIEPTSIYKTLNKIILLNRRNSDYFIEENIIKDSMSNMINRNVSKTNVENSKSKPKRSKNGLEYFSVNNETHVNELIKILVENGVVNRFSAINMSELLLKALISKYLKVKFNIRKDQPEIIFNKIKEGIISW